MDINVLKAAVMIGDSAMLNQPKPFEPPFIGPKPSACHVYFIIKVLDSSNGAISGPSNGVPTRAERHEPFGSRHINSLRLS